MANLLITKSAFEKMLRIEMKKARPDSDDYQLLFRMLSRIDEMFPAGTSYSVPEMALTDGRMEKAFTDAQRDQRSREIAHKMGVAPTLAARAPVPAPVQRKSLAKPQLKFKRVATGAGQSGALIKSHAESRHASAEASILLGRIQRNVNAAKLALSRSKT